MSALALVAVVFFWPATSYLGVRRALSRLDRGDAACVDDAAHVLDLVPWTDLNLLKCHWRTREGDDFVRVAQLYWRATGQDIDSVDSRSDDEFFARVERLAEHDDLNPAQRGVLQQYARTRVAEPARQKELFQRAAALARTDSATPAETYSDPLLRVLAHVGQPVELEFDDALGGARWKLADQRGRWVLVHCSDLDRLEVREDGRDEQFEELRVLQPRLRELGGVLVTVNESLGADGLESMRARARSSGVDWPVFFEHDDSETAWKTRLEINETPLYLLVDPSGALAAVCARPKPLVEFARARIRAH